MQKIKTFKITAPLGNNVIPKEKMSEQELREFALQILQNEELGDVWVEKIQQDPIAEVVEWLTQSGYQIVEV